MKKILTLITVLAISLSAPAADYTDRLEVTINGQSSTQQATISLTDDGAGNMKFELPNFVFFLDGQAMPVGNIALTDVKDTVRNGVRTLLCRQDISITAGNLPDYPMWVGPSLGTVPVDLVAELRGDQLYAVINIDMSATLQQVIQVTFGTGGYQVGNSGFEQFHTATAGKATSDEPNHWHSFMSCTGALAGFVSSTPHTFVSDMVRPGSQGSKSVLVKSASVFGIVANGTLTTGRLKAGSIDAASADNCSFSDPAATDTDANGDPFYATFNGRPDSLVVWVKFKQQTPVAEFPYATINAVLTDGSYYQDPEDKTYKNVVARAACATIESNGNVWQRLAIPFLYETERNDTAQAPETVGCIHVTISTNAAAGKGTAEDSLLVDDLALVYNSAITDIKVKGVPATPGNDSYTVSVAGGITADDIAVSSDGHGASKQVTLTDTDYGVLATITVTSADLKHTSTANVRINGATITGIGNVKQQTGSASSVTARYGIDGRRTGTQPTGKLHITRYANGKTVKSF